MMTGMEENPQSNEPSSESLSDSGMSQRVPKCARCRSHGINRELKGHKEKCQFKDCQCRSCLLVVERQKITATRVAHLRHQRKIDKQRNVGYYSAYAGLTEEEEFVLTRYVDGTEEKFKHRLPPSDYDYIDGRPYKIPAVHYNGFHSDNITKPYTNFYPPSAWDYHRGDSRLSPCTRECCVPRRDRPFTDGRFAVRKLYEEGLSERKIGGRFPISPRVQSQNFEERRLYNESFNPHLQFREAYHYPRMPGYDMKRPPHSEAKPEQPRNDDATKQSEKEAEIEVDVERVNIDESQDKEERDQDKPCRIKSEENEKVAIDKCSNSSEPEEQKAFIDNHRSKVNGYNSKGSPVNESEDIDREKQIEEHRRKRDEFIRSKCSEVLSVMFPDFDGKLIRQIAEKSDYDIQKSVEHLLEIKKQSRAGETKSAFLLYKDRREWSSSNGGRSPCQCCVVRPAPIEAVKPRYFEVRKRDWVETGDRDGMIFAGRPEAKRPSLEL